MDLSALEWKEWAAIIGAITGVSALVVQFFQYIHLKPKLRIDVQPECMIIDEAFKVKNSKEEGIISYKPATHVVVTNLGQMSTAILGVQFYAQSQRRKWRLFNFLNKRLFTTSYDAFVKQNSKPPCILNSGHAWLAIADLETFRRNMDKSPYVFLEIKSSHRKKPIKKRVKLRGVSD